MNSFRVVDAKFRILKGGKIGLAICIALTGGILLFGTTNASATDYFTDVQKNASVNVSDTTGLYDVTVETATNSGTTTSTRTEISADSVVFKPTSWVGSTYGTPSFLGDVDSDSNGSADYSTYNLNRTTSDLILNLTFDSNANASSISKDATTISTAPISSFVNIYSHTTYNLTSSSSSAYTANLIFNGSNTVSGNTDIDDGNIQIKGNNVVFQGAIKADSIDINSSGVASLNTISGSTTSDIVFSGAGTANLYNNLAGDISTTANNQGTITSVGSSQTITGNVGTSTLGLSSLNIGSNTNATNYSTTTVNGNVFATSTVLNNNGTTNSSQLILSSGKNITSSISTADANMGILTLTGGTQTVTGQVGTDTFRLEQINSGSNGATSTFVNDVYSNTINNTGTGTTTFKNDVKATNVNVNAGTTTFEDNLTATTTTITTGTGNFNTVSGTTSSNIVFTNTGTANLYSDLTGNVTTNADNQGTLTIVGSSSGKTQSINGNIGTSSSLDLNILNIAQAGNSAITTIDGNVFVNSTVLNNGTTNSSELILASGNNITSTITTADVGKGILTLAGGTQTVTGSVGSGAELKEVNAGVNGSNSTFSSDVFATNLDLEGTGTVNLNGNFEGTAINYNDAGIVNLANGKNITAAIISDGVNQGTLNLIGSSIVSGQVADITNKLNVINAGVNGSNSTFSSDVFATTTNISSGEIKFVSDLTSDINALTSDNGIVTFVGDVLGNTQNVTGNIGSSSNSINTLNVGENGTNKYSTTIIDGNIYATNTILNNGISNNSTLELTDGSNITSTIKTSKDSQGILTFLGDSIATGTIGTDTEKLAQINAADTGKTVRFNSSLNADKLNLIADGTVVLADNSNINSSITTTINNQGTLDFEGNSTVTGEIGTSLESLKEITLGTSGKTVNFKKDVYASNIIFESDGTVNSDGNLTTDINFSGNNATVNISDGKGILGSVETLATNNTGILNFKGDGVIDGIIGSASLGIKELNINTNNEQDSGGNGVMVTYSALGRELYADVINLRNNATLTLGDNVNLINTGSDDILVKVDTNNTGTLTFLGTSSIQGEVGESNKILNTINAGAIGETVTFDDMVYAKNLKYLADGKVVLNGNKTPDSLNEAMIGTVDFDTKSGTLEIGDNVNLTTGTSGIQFTNANDAVLKFAGNSIITGILGGNTAGNSTFERIYAGADGKTVTFKNDVHVQEANDTTLHVSGTGVVNFEGNLVGDLIYDANGTVNVNNGKSIIVSTISTAVKTANNHTGILNFKGETTLYGNIGTSILGLESVTFASEGTANDSYTQVINKNIYAQNINIGNNLNKTTVDITADTTFNGNLNLGSNSILNVDEYDIIVADNLDLASNSTLKFKVYTTDLSAGQAVENANSGGITSDSLSIADNTKININYDGTWNGAGKYNLVTASNTVTTNYEGTELNGLVSDNSIIDSVVKNDGTNLTLFADRTSGGSFDAEDLYIVKSEIGEHYSNGASQALAGYANEKDRAGALADIIRNMEELEGGLVVSDAKKQEMIKTQRLLAPTANNSNMQTSITASNLALSTIGGRLGDLRRDSMAVFSPNYIGLSSGNNSFDTSLWIKAMGSSATQDKIKNYDGFDTSTYGMVGGMDKTLNNGSVFGLALAYSTTKTNQDNLASDGSDTTSIQATAYASKEFGNGYVDGYLSYGQHKTDGTRTANSGKLSSRVDADQISAKVETGYSIPVNDGIFVTPFTSLEYGMLNQKGYTEKGTSYQNDALKVDGIKSNRGTVEVGAKMTTNIALEDVLIIPQFSASVYNSFGDTKSDIKAQFVGGGKEFVTPVQELNKTMINVGFGVETKISDSTSLIFDIDHDRSKDGSFEGYSGSVTFGVSF